MNSASVSASVPRITAIDLARFLALVGMFAAHLGGPRPPAVDIAITGFPAALFAVVGGMSAILSTERLAQQRRHLAAAMSLVLRGGYVIVLGLCLVLAPTFVIVILVYYGVSLVVVSTIRRLSSTMMFVLAGAVAIAGPFVSASVRSAMQLDDVGALDLGSPVSFVSSVLFTGAYPVITWIAYLLVGMGFCRALLTASPAGRRRFSVMSFLIAVGAMVVSMTASVLTSDATVLSGLGGAFGAASGSGWQLILSSQPHSGTTLDIAITASAAIAVVAGLLVLPDPPHRRWAMVFAPVLSAGAAPLTLYVAHVIGTVPGTVLVILSGTSGSAAPGWVIGWGAFAIHVSVAVMIGGLLHLLGRKGPLESLGTWISRRAEGRQPESAASVRPCTGAGGD